MDVQAYLNRINYHGSLEPSAETLRRLHLAHLLAVPFENLSIHASEPIVLEDDALFEKIVSRRRGGFCYELNGLFAALLRAVGFKVSMLSAQVADDEGGFSRDFDHMTLIVSGEERWLADVGFGESFVEPLWLDTRDAQVQRDRAYRIVADGEWLILERAYVGIDWKPQYRFTLQPYQYPDYAEMCEYHQTSPLSHFTRSRICSLLTQTGRISLTEKFLITTESDHCHERAVAAPEEYAEMLRQHFGIVMK
ncbi:MAG: arylamine N-acetyltransferase [Acidobacteriota bacterium]